VRQNDQVERQLARMNPRTRRKLFALAYYLIETRSESHLRREGKSRGFLRRICELHAKSAGEDRDLCPIHAKEKVPA
jgi:hypothetical protein